MLRVLRRRHVLALCLAAFVIVFPCSAAFAQIRQVVVGLTPYCSEGLAGCWQTASNALPCLDGVKSTATSPDTYNCTVSVFLKEPKLPEVDAWTAELRAAVGGIYTFRGVEVTADGTVEERQEGLVLVIPGITTPLPLATLQHKLQWNFRARSAREPEPHEARAFADLRAKLADANGATLHVQVTGPLHGIAESSTLEVREWFSNGEDHAVSTTTESK